MRAIRDGSPPAITCPSFLASPSVVGATNMVAIVQERLALAFQTQHGLQVLEPPFATRALDVSLLWAGIHPTRHTGGFASRWPRPRAASHGAPRVRTHSQVRPATLSGLYVPSRRPCMAHLWPRANERFLSRCIKACGSGFLDGSPNAVFLSTAVSYVAATARTLPGAESDPTWVHDADVSCTLTANLFLSFIRRQDFLQERASSVQSS
jgi:hypothetical protein